MAKPKLQPGPVDVQLFMALAQVVELLETSLTLLERLEDRLRRRFPDDPIVMPPRP